ncbi:MAG: aldo/keto reductase [Ruminococcus sp.]|nr:aldo/keto reductase [Ruminococcus sp.]
MDNYTLSNGVQIPVIGFGTWQMPNDETGVNAVLSALEAGYRHIDTAQGYRNEQAVGKALRLSGIPRNEVFITSKLDNTNHSYELTMSSFAQTLENLGTDYLDLFLIHWPNPLPFRSHWQNANAETWKAFEELYNAGKIRAIGTSNFRQHHITELLKTAQISPQVNQIRLCPGETQPELVAFCKQHGILLEAYSPLGTGKIFSVPEIISLSEKYNTTPARLCIRWSIQNGWLPLPKSVNPERIKQNLDVFSFTISPEDCKTIADLTDCIGHSLDPDTTPW